jgi:3-phenylpropionate/trans-cinnamate dioxygenase ferredoxin reductase subunit
MSSVSSVVIVGAGQAGLQTAASLREGGFSGEITMIGAEAHYPYHRPPLSKIELATPLIAAPTIRPSKYFTDRRINILLNETAVHLDRGKQVVVTSSGRVIHGDHVVLATGASNRRLRTPGASLQGVHYLRTADEAGEFRSVLKVAKRLVVVGAGFIGLEVAALARQHGIATTVVDIEARPMSRAVSQPVSDYFTEWHAAAGVTFLLNQSVASFDAADGKVAGVRLASGECLPADVVLIGVGALPNIDLAEQAGLRIANGIAVDSYLTTSDANVSAIGDCASFPSPSGQTIRLESVQNAADHARSVAGKLIGKRQPYNAVPWFWSDQGNLKLQIVGLVANSDELLVSGDPAEHSFSVFCFREKRLVGIESVNRPADHMAGRRLLKSNQPIDPNQIVAANFDLSTLQNALSSHAVEVLL